MNTFTAYLVYDNLGQYGAALQRPGCDTIFGELTLELPTGWAVYVSDYGDRMLFDPDGKVAELFATPQKIIGAANGKGCRYFHRVLPDDGQKKNLSAFRVSAGLTQQQLADASGVNIRQIQRVENGEADIGNISAKNLLALSDALGIDPRQLLNQ